MTPYGDSIDLFSNCQQVAYFAKNKGIDMIGSQCLCALLVREQVKWKGLQNRNNKEYCDNSRLNSVPDWTSGKEH
jgi:hypothetical protein